MTTAIGCFDLSISRNDSHRNWFNNPYLAAVQLPNDLYDTEVMHTYIIIHKSIS